MPEIKRDGLTNWVESYAQDMINWAAYRVSDVQLAQDLVQDTFLAAAQKLDTFRGDSSPKTWLFSILNFKIIDHYRAKAKQPVKTDYQQFSNFFDGNGDWIVSKRPKNWDEDEQHLLDNSDFQAVLKQCLDNLPEKWNACIHLKFMTDKKGDEICQELDITSTNFWQIIHRAKLSLRECIENKWFKD